MALFRRGTYDQEIWNSVQYEYVTVPTAFDAGDVVLDIGCHTGAFCDLAARRGATVVGYEANRENHALAAINLRELESVRLHHAAVWRSDVPAGHLTFTPHIDTANTGGGSVLFDTRERHWAARAPEHPDPAPPDMALSTHDVEAVPLDDILTELGTVRFLKIDVEGAEFPILLTASELDRVRAIAGEYHEFSSEDMALISPEARVGDERYSADVLRRRLEEAGFADVTFVPDRFGRGFFSAQRPTGSRPTGAR
jgi:FkbM family methyltransferase